MAPALLAAALAVLLGAAAVRARAYLSQPQAIALAFPAARVERKTAFLTEAQAARIAALARTPVPSRVVSYYVARSSAGVAGVAFFERRVVRTLPVTYMAVVRPPGALERVELLDFEEPDDYLPPPRWLALMRGRRLDDELALGRGVPRITGASLTSQAMTDGVRLILATYEVAVKGTL